jgi:signal transduction histidine kinase
MRSDLAPRDWPVRPLAQDAALCLVLYTVVAWGCIAVGRQPGSIATVWLANGVAAALIVSAPRERLLPLLAACGLGNLLANLAQGDTLRLSALFVLPNLLEVALAVALLRQDGRAERFATAHGLFLKALLAGAVLPPLLGATLGAALLHAVGFAQFSHVWVDWYFGAALGAAMVLPLVLALRTGLGLNGLRRLALTVDMAVLAAVVGATLAMLKLLPYPFIAISTGLIAVAFTRPRLTTFAAVPLAAGAMVVSIAYGFYLPVAATADRLGHVQVHVAILLIVVPAQMVAIAVARQRALATMLAAVGGREDEVVLFVDDTGIVRWVNRARELFWGTPNATVIGQLWSRCVPPQAWAEVIGPQYERARAGATVRQVVDFDFPLRGPSTVLAVLQPALDEDGHQIGVISSSTDITETEAARREQARLADELRRANTGLEQFVRIASHDLREPLNTILQFCNLIQRDPASNLGAASAMYFVQVQGGADRMRTLLDDVLRFVRLEGAPEEAAGPVALDALLSGVLDGLHHRLDSTQARLDIAPLGVVNGHASLLGLVLQNLVTNALKFMPPDRLPRLQISREDRAGEAWIIVADNGIGIPADKLAELGTPFRRLHARRKFEGTGLGLAICKRIAEQHGGRLEIASTPGEGSRFSLVLPAG